MNALNRQVRQTRQHGSKILTQRDAEAAAALDDGKNRGDSGTSILASDVNPVLPSDNDRAH